MYNRSLLHSHSSTRLKSVRSAVASFYLFFIFIFLRVYEFFVDMCVHGCMCVYVVYAYLNVPVFFVCYFFLCVSGYLCIWVYMCFCSVRFLECPYFLFVALFVCHLIVSLDTTELNTPRPLLSPSSS